MVAPTAPPVPNNASAECAWNRLNLKNFHQLLNRDFLNLLHLSQLLNLLNLLNPLNPLNPQRLRHQNC